MKDEDVKIGMKVVPHDKTATGWGDLFGSSHWKAARENGQPFLFVLRETTNAYDDTSIWVLSEEQDGYGDLFNASDFEPYDAIHDGTAAIARHEITTERKCKTCKFRADGRYSEHCHDCHPLLTYKPNRPNWQPIKPRRKELQAEIDRLKAENDDAWKQISALKNDIADMQETIKTQARDLTTVINDRNYYKDNCREWSVKYDKDIAAKDAEIAELGQRISEDAPKQQVASEKPDLLPVGTKVMVKYDKDIYAATIINIDRHDTTVPYFVRFGDGEERWVRRRRVTVIPTNPPDLLPVGTRVMLTGTIIGVDEKDDEFPYGVELDHDSDGEWWLPKSSVKPINND